MKKFLSLVMLFFAVAVLGETLPVNKWRPNYPTGNFKASYRKYPLMLEAVSAPETRKIWGRLVQKVTLTPGKKYEFTVRYKLNENFKGQASFWLRSSKGADKNNNLWLLDRAQGENKGMEKTMSGILTANTEAYTVNLNIRFGTGIMEVYDVQVNEVK